MLQIIEQFRERVIKNSDRFFKGDAVLLLIYVCFRVISLKIYYHCAVNSIIPAQA